MKFTADDDATALEDWARELKARLRGALSRLVRGPATRDELAFYAGDSAGDDIVDDLRGYGFKLFPLASSSANGPEERRYATNHAGRRLARWLFAPLRRPATLGDPPREPHEAVAPDDAAPAQGATQQLH